MIDQSATGQFGNNNLGDRKSSFRRYMGFDCCLETRSYITLSIISLYRDLMRSITH